MATKKEVIQNLLDLAEKSIIESELKEKFLWELHLGEQEKANEKAANEIKMKFAAQKREREDTYIPWKNLLEKELQNL
jgi:hypothetical protein